MRNIATFTLLVTFGAAVLGGAGHPCEASAGRRAYFRAATADARARVAPFGVRELPGGIVCAEIPPAMLPTFAATPGLTFLGYEGLFQPVPIPAEESAPGSTPPQAAADTRRYCWPPGTDPVGWGIKAMYGDPNLVQPSGGAGVKVGLIDTGVYPHLDIVRRLVKCVNIAPPDTLAPCTDVWQTSHGTMTASVIAADGGADGLGMWGMAPEASIYSYRVCEPNRECWGAYVADGVYAAIADGVNIINMSLAGPGNDDAVRAAIDEAVAHNILVVVAVGNSPPYSYVGYPAAYPEVVSVGAIKENLQPWPFTASGVNDGDYVRETNEIELAAPGDKVLVATKVGCWGILPGTSLAAPMVTGLAAKLWNGDAAATRARLQRAARFRDLHVAGDDTLSGFGLPTAGDFSGSFVINAAAGLGGTISPSGGVALSPGASQTFTIHASDDCFALEDVKVDGASLGPVPNYTFADVRSDHTIEVNSSQASFTITASAGPGAIIPSGVSRVACGSSMRYVFVEFPGCGQIKDVVVDGLSLGPLQSYTFTNVRSNHTIEARFFAGTAHFPITASAGNGGSISPGGVSNVPCGGSQTYTIAPLGGFRILDVWVDGARQGPIPSYTFTAVGTYHEIFALFTSTGAEPCHFTITASAGVGGTISPNGPAMLDCGTTRTYTIKANPCFRIQDVKVDGASMGAIPTYTFTNVVAAHSISATFAPAGEYTITANASGSGTISPSGATSVACGGSQTYSITPSGGCGAYDVKVDGLSKGAISTYTFDNVLADHTISVTFDPGPFSITASAGAGATISPSGVTSVACGDSQTYTITRTGSCAIQDVRVDGVSQGAIPSYTFTNVQANHTISATPAAGPFTITASAGAGGTISPSGVTTVACGGSQSYTITRTGTCASYDVKVDGSSQGPLTSYTFTNVQASHTISVNFSGEFTVNATAGYGGSIVPRGFSGYQCGYIGYYTIYPDICYRTQDVKVDGVSQGPISNYTFLWGSHTIAASFALLGPYSIDASAGPGGTISPGSSASVGCGAVRKYTFNPIDNCHAIQDVIVDGVSVGPRSTYTFNPVTASHTVQAIFSTLGPYTIEVSAGPGGTITPGSAASVACGEGRTYTIASDECHRIQDVKVDGLSRGPITSFQFLDVRENHAIVAMFAELGPFAIGASAGSGGTISPKGESSAACGASLSYSIAADGCHAIQDVKVDGVSQGPVASYKFPAVIAAHSIEATFSTLGPYTITASAGAGANISPAGPASVACGASLSYQIAPDACRALRDVLVDGVSVGALTGYTFPDVHGDHTIVATSAPGMTLSETHAGASWVSDGMVDLTVTGGVPPYAYAWSNGASSQDLGGLGGGSYDVRVTDSQGCVEDLEVTIVSDLPAAVALGHPAPNPSAGAVRMRYAIPAATAVRLSVLDLQGREVAVLADGTRGAGWSWADWNGATRDGRAPGGVYFIRLQAGGRQIVQRFALVR